MNKVLKLVGLVFLLIGCSFLIVTACLALPAINQGANAITVEGTIVELHRGYPTISYTVDGQSYLYDANTRSNNMHIGGTVSLRVNPADPQHPVTSVLLLLMGIFGLIGIVFGGIGLLLTVLYRRAVRRYEELLATGLRVSATIVDVRIDYHVRVNRRHPVYAIAECRHPVTGNHVQVKSQSVFRRDLAEGQTVDVYFDSMDIDRYAVVVTEDRKQWA